MDGQDYQMEMMKMLREVGLRRVIGGGADAVLLAVTVLFVCVWNCCFSCSIANLMQAQGNVDRSLGHACRHRSQLFVGVGGRSSCSITLRVDERSSRPVRDFG